MPVLAVAAVAMNAVFSVAPAAGQSNKVNAPPVITAPGDKTYEQGETITPFGITVTNPDGDTVTVGVSGLPEGLSYAAGKVRGTVADDATPQDYSVTVTANDGSSPAVEAAFTITVTKKPPPEPPRFRRTRMSRGVEENMPPGSPVGNPVAATGGSGNFTYSLSGTDAALFEINPATGQLTTAAGVSFDYEDQSRYSVTVTVTDGDLGVDVTAYITVKVRDVDEPPVIAALNDHTYEQGQTIQPITIEVNDPDNDTVTVGVSGLPEGLSYAAGKVRGTVADDATPQDYSVTVTANDGSNPTVEVSFTITVMEKPLTVEISGPTETQTGPFDVTVTFSRAVNDFTQSDITVGNGSVTGFSGSGAGYTATITPAASGEVTVEAPAGVASGNTASPRFSVQAELDEPVPAPYFPTFADNYSFIQDQDIGTVSLPEATGGHGSLTYSLTPELPEGLTFDASARTLTGVPTSVSAQTEYTYAVTDSNGFTDALTFNLEVNAAEQPALPPYFPVTPTGYEFTEGRDIGTEILPEADGGSGGFSYSLGPELPEGLSFDPASRALTGTPAVGGDYSMTYTATDADGTQADWSFTMEILRIAANTTKNHYTTDWSDCGATVRENQGECTITVRSHNSSDGSERLALRGDGPGRTAHDGREYDIRWQGSRRIRPGRTLEWTLRLNDNEKLEGKKTISLKLKGWRPPETPFDSGHYEGIDTIKIPLLDDEQVTVTIEDQSVTEGEQMTFTARLIGPEVPVGFTVTPRFTAGTASGNGEEFIPNEAPLSFSGRRWEQQTFTVDTQHDEWVEYDETFTVDLDISGLPDKLTDNVSAESATGIILDDDQATVTIEDVSKAEGKTLTFRVSHATGVVQDGFDVEPIFTDGTATQGSDYSPKTSGTLHFAGRGAASDLNRPVKVSTIDDDLIEGDETFTVTLKLLNAPPGVTVGEPATGTITDDDGGPTGNETVTITGAAAAEGEALTFTVTLNRAVQGGLTVTPSFSDGTAAADSDYTPNTTPLSFTGTAGEQRTITVETIEDAVVEDDETFTVSLGVSDAPSGVTVGAAATGTIEDDDGTINGTAAVTIADADAVEGEALTFTVTLNKAVQGGLTVTPSFSDGTAAQGTDYTPNTAALSFAGTLGEQRTITVETIKDAVVEDDETFTVSLNVSDTPAGVTVGSPATGTITDDDGEASNAPPAITAPGDKTYEQGEEITPFGITVTDADGDTLTVTLTGLPSGLSYTSGQVQGTVSADAAEQAYTVTIQADDGVNAAVTETFTITVTAAQAQNAPPVITAPDDKTYEQGETITPFGFTVTDADGDTLTVTVSGLPSGLSYTSDQVQGTVAADATAQAYMVTIEADDGVNTAVEETFTITVTEAAPSNAPPAITAPGDKTYEQGEEIIPFGFTVTDADGDTLTVTVSGLPSGLSYTSDQVQGTVAADATAQAYMVTIEADDGVNTAVEETFTITVTEAAPSNAPPVITAPGDKTYEQGETITPFGITVTDADGDTLTVTLTGLPSGLSYTSDQVQGTVAADAAEQAYTVTIQADDGVNAAVTETFTITVTAAQAQNAPPVITAPDDKTYEQGETITPFGITVTDADGDTLTVTLTGLPSGLSYTSDQVQGTVLADAAEQAYTVTIQADDGVNAAVTETFTITVTAAQAQNAPPVITAPDDKTYEQGETITPFGITVTDADGDTLTVTVSGLPSGLSYTSDQVQGTVSADAAAQAYTVTIEADDGVNTAVEETFTITVTIKADDGVNAAVTIADADAVEGEALTFTVTLNKAVQGGLTVTPSFSDGTAAADSDYTPNTAALSFTGAAGEQQTFTVPTIADAVVEDDETFTVSLSLSDAPSGVTAGAAATGTITDDDSGPTGNETVTITGADAVEGEALTFTVTLNRAVQGGLTVTPSFSDGTAAADSDYTPNTTPLSFTGTVGEQRTITVETIEDAVVEDDETFSVSLGVSDAPAGVTAGGAASGTIEDDDGDTPGNETVTITGASAVEGEALSFTVALNRAVQGGLTVTPSFSDGTAAQGTDYTPNTAALSFAGTVGEQRTITVETIKDAVVEDDETFTVSLGVSDAPAGVTVGSPATGTITDDDGEASNAPPVITAPGDKTYEQGEEITPFGFTVTDADGDTLTVTVSGLPSGLSYTSDQVQGTVAADATAQAYMVTIEADDGVNTAVEETFTITVTEAAPSNAPPAITAPGDKTYEQGEEITPFGITVTDADGDTLTVTLTGLPSGLSYTSGQVQGTVSADATAQAYTVTIEADDGVNTAVEETFTITVTEAAPSNAPPAITAPGDKTYEQGEEITPFGITVTDADGDTLTVTLTGLPSGLSYTSGQVQGTVSADAAAQAYTVTIEADDGVNTAVEETFTITVTIKADDGVNAAVTAAAQVTVADASAGEGASITFTVTLDKAVSGGLTVTPRFTDVTATSGVDYSENTAGIRFTGTAGEQQTFTVPTIEDAVVEGDETFTVSLDVSDAPSGVTAGAAATGTITDDDGGPTGNETVTITGADAAEGEALTFTVTLNRAVQGGLTVTPSFSDGTAAQGTDYTPNTAALSFTGTAGEQRTITVQTIEDAVVEDDETFTVSLGVSDAPSGVTVGAAATGTIEDDDGTINGTAAVTIADADAVEGEALTFTVTLNNAVQGGLTVTPSFSDGTAAQGTDYTPNTAALSFAGTLGEQRTITVPTIEDTAVEDDETFTVSLGVSNALPGVTAGEPATGTITAADGGNPSGGAAVTISDASAAEGEALTFTVTLHTAVEGGLTVTPVFADETATEGADYTANPALLHFTGAAGEQRTITVETTEDEVVEDDETFRVSLNVSNAPSGVTAGAPATGTIEDDDGGPTGGGAKVTITNASAAEGEALTFTVTLDKAVEGGLTVKPSFRDGTAAEGADYTANPAPIRFTGKAGEQRTITVETTEDEVLEGDETFTVSLELSSASTVTNEEAMGTIRDDEVPETRATTTRRVLSLLARSMASEAVEAIGERFISKDPGTPQMSLGAMRGMGAPGVGGPHGLLEQAYEQPFAELAWLDGGHFALPAGPDAEPGWANWTLWGRAATRRSSRQTQSGAKMRGDLFTTHLGFETRPRESLLLGTAVSHSMGALGYTVEAPLVEGRVPGEGDGGLTSVQPYLHWAPQQGLTLWGMGGFGSGSLTVTDSFGTVDTPLGMRMFAGGGRKELTDGGNMAIKADAFRATLRSQEQADLMEATGTATRVRLLLEGSADWTVSPAARLTSRVQAGSRWDDGSDLSGMGAEVGGGLAYVHTRLKLGLEVQGRYLLAHQAEGFEEWGAGVALRVGPGVDGPGPWFALEPKWGAADSRVQALWGSQAGPVLHSGSHGAPGAPPSRLAMTAGYRLNEASELSVEAAREHHARGGSGIAFRILGRLTW